MEATAIVAVEVPPVPFTGFVPKVTLIPDGGVGTERVTDELNPFEGVTVIVEVPLLPATMGDGLTADPESVKDGFCVVEPVRAAMRPELGLPHPVTRSYPVTAE